MKLAEKMAQRYAGQFWPDSDQQTPLTFGQVRRCCESSYAAGFRACAELGREVYVVEFLDGEWRFALTLSSNDEAKEWIDEEGVTCEYDYRIRRARLIIETEE